MNYAVLVTEDQADQAASLQSSMASMTDSSDNIGGSSGSTSGAGGFLATLALEVQTLTAANPEFAASVAA